MLVDSSLTIGDRKEHSAREFSKYAIRTGENRLPR
jgi:hypothetical protein